MNHPDPSKYCLCPGDKTLRYRTDNRGRTTLRCVKCGKQQHEDQSINFQPERQPA